MPSSSALVATMTQSRPSAKACSAAERSSMESEECVTKVSTPSAPQRARDRLHAAARLHEHQPLLPRVQRRDHPRGVVVVAHVVERDAGAVFSPGAAHHRPGRRAPGEPREDLVGVAHRRRERDALHVATAVAREALEHDARCPPRSSRTKAWTSSMTTARSPANSRRAGTFGLMSMTSSDSGVVSSRSAGSRRKRFRAPSGVSPCQVNARRPIISA
jgi:hypothetical protein